jgi:glycosyltransferase involved in cell wall biosynthesis
MPKLLILAPTFFPDPVVSGIRVTQWARFLPEFGWTPLVLCRHFGYEATAGMLANEVNAEVKVEYLGPRAPAPTGSGQGARRPHAGLKDRVLKPIVEAICVPDALAWKWKGFTRQAIEIAQRWQPDVVLSSTPPHSIHHLGRAVARAINIPWVADFRDPYLFDSRYGPHGTRRLSAWRHAAFDRAIYRDAQLITHAIPLHGRWASRRYPSDRDKIRILTNGVPGELLDEQFLQSAQRSPRVSVRAVGVLGQGAVQTIGAAMQQLASKGIDAEFRHVGRAADSLSSIPAELKNRLILRGPVSHREALREIAGADVLLKYDDLQRAQVSGLSSKLFEYLSTGRPVVAINPTRADWTLIDRLPWCWGLEDPAPNEVATALQNAIATGVKAPEEWLTTFRRQYNRRNQTQQLASWLDALMHNARSR